ncbi:MAG: hypothetical protein AB7T49_08995 [Oligoflexales bacterium]
MDISRSLRWVRGLRNAKRLGLSANSLETIESSIRGEAGLREPLPSDEGKMEPAAAEDPLGKLELRLRKLAQAKVAWGNIEAVLWEMYAQAEDTGLIARKMVELALVHASPAEVTQVLGRLSALECEFYQDLRTDVRGPLFVLLWQNKRTEITSRLLRGVRHNLLLPIEKLYCFYDLLRRSELIEAFMLFKDNQEDLVNSVAEFGEKVGVEINRVLFDAGKLAFDLGYDAYCRDVLRALDQNSGFYPEALNLLLRTKVDDSHIQDNVFIRKLNKTKDWRERVRLFYEFLGEAKRLGGIKDLNRPLLNELLVDPLKWVPASPDAWGAMSRAIVDHIGLDQLFPNVWAIFSQNILRVYASDLDTALWSPVLDAQFFDKQDQYYWHGVALFHRYLGNLDSDDCELWRAADFMSKAKASRGKPLPVDWETLNRTAYQYVHKQLSMSETKRVARLRQLRMALDPSKLVRSDIEEYLKEIKRPPLGVLERLISIARYNEEAELELTLLKRKAEQSHFANQELERVWRLAANTGKFDLAWRAATILKSRDALDERIFPSWAISGEKRSEYHLNIPHLENVVESFRDLTVEEQKFLKAIVRIGHHIPALLQLLDANIKAVKPVPSKPGSKEYEVDKILNALGWLGNVKRYYQYEDDYAAHSLPMPSFIHVLPDNTWSLLIVKLSQRLGLTAWNWKLSNLKKYIDGLMPQIASGKLGGSWGVGRWLKNLNPEGRNAWCDLASIINKFPDERGYEIISILLTRIAVIINQNHIQALNSLRIMRWSVYNIWQLENWLLSDCYSQIRRKFGTIHSVPVPLSLRKMSTILKEKA